MLLINIVCKCLLHLLQLLLENYLKFGKGDIKDFLIHKILKSHVLYQKDNILDLKLFGM